ncbi:hypothetical protein D3C77_393750 [compost metagenome]
MIISLSPFRSDDLLMLSKAGDVLTINGEEFDFSRMVDGDTLPTGSISSQWFGGPVNRIGTELQLTIRLPLPINYSQEQAYPVPLVNVQDGGIRLPQPLPPLTEAATAQEAPQ